MRERTPSADDTPKRAPPAPPREAASADVAGSKTSSETAEAFGAAKFSSSTTASPTAVATTTASSPSSVDVRMVASTHSLDDLGVSHPASASTDRQQQQEKHAHTYKSAQTAQDKRSRLSNVINNLRKKVPDSRSGDSPREEEDDRNSVERNLETLEKYVMTVLNGVIKDEEDDDRDVGRKKEIEKSKEPEKLTEDQEDEDSKGPAAKFEPSKPNESRTEAAVFPSELTEKAESPLGTGSGKEASLEYEKLDDKDDNLEQTKESGYLEREESQVDLTGNLNEEKSCKFDTVEKGGMSEGNKCSAKETKPEDQSIQEIAQNEGHEEERKESKSLGTIIMERLSDHQSDDKGNNDASKEDYREFVSENTELRNVCRDLLNDLLNGINQLIDENSQEKEEVRTLDTSSEEPKDSKRQDFSMTSLHCSLPLDKVASVLQNCQSTELAVPQPPSSPSSSSSSSQGSKSPPKPPSPTVRHLCLYCDRKFLSISLRQRHTERVHQQGGGRRSERNSRKPSQNCQYCSDKCAEGLEGLFQHMVGNHGDKYHACVQCSTRYLTREALVGHMSENHGVNLERNFQIQEKIKESSPCKELVACQSPRDKTEPVSSKDKKSEDPDHGMPEHRTDSILLKPPIIPPKDTFSNPGSPEFDSSFYSSVSCNIRENLLHHLDGKLQSTSSSVMPTTSSTVDSKPQQQQSYYEHNVNQIQLPIDISLTAATPVYSKEYTNEEYENSSEYAQKPGKSNRSHPRRVSFEKYNFPRKYDGKEQWTCSIKDLSKFDISTQLSLRKKQQVLKEHVTLNRLHQIPSLGPSETTDIAQDEQNVGSEQSKESQNVQEASSGRNDSKVDQVLRCDVVKSEPKSEASELKSLQATKFTLEFGNFLMLRKWDEKASNDTTKKQELVYAELTGEWSRPRIYVCGACASRHVTLKEMEDHKASLHPNVWCSHFEFSGDQRELYKHLFLPGRNMPTAKAKTAVLVEKVCTKCSRNCNTLPELHRHMLECGGDQAWLLGLFGNGKKKCKWRPFGSRSRRRRQRGMKRNIQNSQTPRVNTPKEKQPTGPRVRPSDRESIQKMLANLPPKRATRKVMQDNTLRAQGRLRNVQTRSRPRMVGDNTTASRMSRNKAALRNKLLKNAKSIQRNRCRIDNISAVIESVVRNYNAEEKQSDEEKNEEERPDTKKDAKEKREESTKEETEAVEKSNRAKILRGPRILSKKRNLKTKEGTVRNVVQMRKMGNLKAKIKSVSKNASETKFHDVEDSSGTGKNVKVPSKSTEHEADEVSPATSPTQSKSPSPSGKNKLSVQTTPKRKRPVDPVASLNASIKAKSQLRTQDGKFARNPNKSLSPQKSPEIKPPIVGRQLVKGRSNETSPESSVTRSRLRAISRNRNDDQLPKRTTRLSSDSDKMPTLEPAVEVPSNNEEDVDVSANDLPILSPATSSSSTEKASRGKSLINKNSEEKESLKKGSDIEGIEGKNEVSGDLQEEDKEQKHGKTRRAKSDGKHLDKNLKTVAVKGDVSKEKPKGTKEKLKKESASTRILNAEEKKTSTLRASEETNLKKELRHKKEDGITKTLETRSNSKTKLDKILDADGQIKIQNVPFEVKKLIGSDNKEDLLTKLVLTSRNATSKRCLRQSTPKVNPDQGKTKTRVDSEIEKTSLNSETSPSAFTGSSKKETGGFRRKSLRKTEKKLEDKITPKDDKLVIEETNKIRNAVNEVKTTIKGRRSSSLPSENKSVSVNQISPVETQNKAEVELSPQNTDNENSSNKRQTRGSVLNNEADAPSKENCSEQHDVCLEKNTYLGKRRGRIKSSNDIPDKDSSEDSQTKNEEYVKNNLTEVIDKINTVEENKASSDDKESITPEGKNAFKVEGEKDRNVTKAGRSEDVSSEAPNINLSLNNLQLETSGSIDSGKENSIETVVGVQKLKVGRPRKSWGSRRERTSKRSLNNVIGILTEGMNIPVESQQSVVLTVQTTLDSTSANGISQNSTQESNDGSSRSANLEGTDKSPETANSVGNLIEETCSSVEKTNESSKQLQAAEVSAKDSSVGDSLANIQKIDSSSNDTKEQSPTNDIILDLSRRKQKGKGSFLEKIVSKIAKQKDALLEGEVGSLLDTAADELTSILDEVGPGLSETTDNPADVKNEVSNSKSEEKTENSKQEIKEKSVDKDFSVTNNNSNKILEDTNTDIDKLQVVEKEEKKTLLKEEECRKEDTNDIESINQKEMKNETINNSDHEIADQQIEILKVQKDANSDHLKPKDQIIPVVNESASNGTLLLSSGNVSASTLDCSTQAQSLKQEDKLIKQDQKGVIEDSKSKRKSKKRSLEGNSPKKNKRKSIEPTDESEENLIPEELHLADIMKLIDRSKEVPSTGENTEDDFSVAAMERVQPGKRKTENNDTEVTNSIDSKETEHIQTSEDTNNSVKKIKIDVPKNIKEQAKVNDEDKIVIEKGSIEDSTNESDDKTCVNNEGVHCNSPQTTGKRKSSTEVVEQFPETESVVRRSSKRRSVLEEKVSSEEETSKIELPVNESGTSRRRSSRTKSTVQQKNQGKTQKDTEDDSTCNIINAVTADNSELPLNEALKKNEPLENDSSSVQKSKETNKAEESFTPDSIENRQANKEIVVENIMEADLKVSQSPVIPKVSKKRGRKKKVLLNEQMKTTNDFPEENSNSKVETQLIEPNSIVLDEIPDKKSLRISRVNEEIEKETKISNSISTSHTPSPSLEHFKIPEVTDVLQLTKKRTSKRKSITDEHLDTQTNISSVESEANSAESSDSNKTFVEKEEQEENKDQKVSPDGRKRLSRNSNKGQLELERPSSSGSIDLVQSNKTRSSKRKQLSSEDLLNQEDHRAGSVDSLSETSVVSESCYFRKKRFSKKKKGFQAPPEDAQTDTSITDSESIDTERHTDRRQSLKRRAKKNISFFELQFDLVDDFDIPMDIEECLQPVDTLKDLSQELKTKSSQVKDKVADDTTVNNTLDCQHKESKAIPGCKQSAEEEEEEEEAEEGSKVENTDIKADAPSDAPEDFQTPKKRAAGNFVVVHKKTGEILIVEKRKKLTKEAAKFFCDVCATSFTRKSSLKKHNLSQSHLLQLTKSKKDKTFNENIEETYNASWREASDQNETSNEENKSLTNETMNVSEELKEDQEDLKSDSKNVEPEQNISGPRTTMEQESFINSQTTQQHIVEDELLDEEICKITENMSHDEYVLTEHCSPAPESTSTPIQMEIKKTEDTTKKKKHDKKKDKAKKKNLVEEHSTLNTSDQETSLNLTSGSLLSVLSSDTSIKISKSSHLGTSESPTNKTSNSSESRTDVSILEESSSQEKRLDSTDVSMLEKDLEIENLRKGVEQIKEQSIETELENKLDGTLEDIPKSDSNVKVIAKENQVHERLSLKLTINKRNIEQFKETNTETNRSLDLNSSREFEAINSNRCAIQTECTENYSYINSKSNQELNSPLSENLKEENKRDLNSTVDDSNVTKETMQIVDIVKTLEEESGETDQITLNNLYEQNTSIVTESTVEDIPDLQNQSAKTPKHSKVKKNKAKKHVEETETLSTDSLTVRKSSKLKANQHKQSLDEVMNLSNIVDDRGSNEFSETFECKIIDKADDKTAKLLENNSGEMNNSIRFTELESETNCKFNALDVIENLQKLSFDLGTSKEGSQINVREENQNKVDSENKKNYQLSIEEDGDSFSSIEDKPLSQVLLKVDEKLKEDKKQKMERDLSVNLLKCSVESNHENDKYFKTTFDDKNLTTNDQHIDNSELIDNEKVQIALEEEYKPEMLDLVKNSEKDVTILSESENSETIQQIKGISNNKEVKTSNSTRKSSGKKVSKSHKHSNKESHRRCKNRKTSFKNKIADLTSESDDSEYEDKIESQNKSKIVKSVFGRVFGSEKTDKVKEVLNDWVSKSEDDSDASRTQFRSFSPNESSLKTRESSETKTEEKNVERQSITSSSKRSSGKKSKTNSSSDRAKEKNLTTVDQEDSRPDKYTESQNNSNYKKGNPDTDLLFRRHEVGEILPPTCNRSSKKRAKKRISEEFLSFDNFFERMDDKFNWGCKSDDDSDVSRNEIKSSSPNEPKTPEILEAKADKKRSGKKSKKNSSSDRLKEKDSVSENQEDYHSDKYTELKDNSINRKQNELDVVSDIKEDLSLTSYRNSKKKAKKRISESYLPLGTLFERIEAKHDWESKSEDDSDVSRNEFKSSNSSDLKTREPLEAENEEQNVRKLSTSSIFTSSKKCFGKKSKKNSCLDKAKEKNVVSESQEDSDKDTESQDNSNYRKKSNMNMDLLLRRHCVDEILPPTSCRRSKKKAKKRISEESSLGNLFAKSIWGSKSEDDSDDSRSEFKSSSPNELKIREISESRSEKDMERQSSSSPVLSNPKKRSGKKSKKSFSPDRSKGKNPIPSNQEEHYSDKHGEPKNNSTNRKKNDIDVQDDISKVLPPTGYRNSKKKAEEKSSKSFPSLDYICESKGSSESRNQSKSNLTIKDSGYGSFNYDEDSSKLISLENSTEKDQKGTKKRKSDDLVMEKNVTKNNKESDYEDVYSVKDLQREGKLTNMLSVDLESSHSCSSLTPSSVRNRSPSMGRNSQTTRDSDVDEEDRNDEEMGHRRISPLFVCGTPRSSINSSSNSENEEEDENVTPSETAACKRSSSEFSGEKIVIRSPSSTHKTEVVTIAPTDAIEDNALDVPQEIETAKPRQGKVLNFDEELFVECCSRLKATTENELRGAKKIKLDHNEGYHKKDDQQEGFKGPRDRWRDVESQNSLGSLLESVNQPDEFQLLGEEMYSTRERDYPKRGSRNLRSEYSSRSASPDMSRADNLGYEDSLDVAFEHNNKLRDKIQQRIRESESLIASTFGQKSNSEIVNDKHSSKNDERETLRSSYTHLQDQEHLSGTNLSNGDYNDDLRVRSLQEQQSPKKMNLDSSGFKNRMNSALGGLLDKALSNLLHNNGKNDHNGSTPMKLLAELACARAPTSTAGDSTSQEDIKSVKTSPTKESLPNPIPLTVSKDLQKKTRNPIKELFEKKKEMNERKQQEKSKTEAALRELNVHRQRKTKKTKKHQDFPLIRRGEHGGLVERKKRRDGFERKEEFVSGRIKDVYEFDEEESQMEPNLGSVMSYRNRPGYEVNCLKTKEVDVAELMSKAIGDTLENGKPGDALSTRLESIIDRKFKELEKFAPKTKGALKAFQSEEQQRHITGPMDEFVERKQSQSKRPPEQNLKHPKLKKRNKNPKKKNRNAWYENDSSDEYRTAVKAEDVGVGISKSQRTCSKGKQNIFAELYTSSESEFENEDMDYETKRQRKVKKSTKKVQELGVIEQSQELINKYCSENEYHVDEWRNQDLKDDATKNDCDNKKSESEMSDHPLVIDERKDMDDQRNSDEETENQYERNYELDDLYREDSSVVDSEVEESTVSKIENVSDEPKIKNLSEEKVGGKVDYIQDDELIPLEQALDLLDQADNNLETKYDNVNKEAQPVEHIDTVEPTETVDKTFDLIEESTEKCSASLEDQEEEPDNDLLSLPEKLSTNEKPQKESDNLPLHVFLSRKVQESKKRKEQQLKKMQEEQERILMDFQPTRRQRKCAIGKQGLLAEISSSDEEMSPRDSRKSNDRSDHEKPRKQKRESKERRKERYIEKKHEQMIAKEQKAIEEEILRELGKKKEESLTQNTIDAKIDSETTKEPESTEEEKIAFEQIHKKKHQAKEKQKKPNKMDEDICVKNDEGLNDLENSHKSVNAENNHKNENNQESPGKQKKHPKSPTKPRKSQKGDAKATTGKKGKNSTNDRSRNRTDSKGSKEKESRSASGKRDSGDEELKTTKSWNKVEEGVGVAIGRRKRAAANQLYYWSSSSDEEEMLEVVPAVEEEEDDRLEQHGWIVGDSHKRMITMLAMEKQLKEKRRRSEDEFEPTKAKNKKHRNSTS
ncbi:uncharacterized protein LOC143181101 isoform X2 [Calliopsis andreniformis]|uniref:uncharacterized protein LOC143181101 isoform X2 n=1 Tax=Calliopsis andreniformis TaxID=337506 RepID=UPI003FCE88B0